MIVDSHCHRWNLDLARHPWLDGSATGRLRRTFDRGDYRAAAGHLPLGGAICVQAEESAAELAWLRGPSDPSGGPPLGVVAAVDLRGPRLARRLAAFADRAPGRAPVVGVRDARLLDAAAAGPAPSVMALLAEQRLTVDLLVPEPGRLAEAVRLATAYPCNRFVLDHLPQVCPPMPVTAGRRPGLAALAELPNLVVKFSGLRALADSGGEPLRRLLQEAFELFGSRRLMFGSDWPVSTDGGGLDPVVRTIRAHLPDLTPAQQDDFWHRTALRAYGLGHLEDRTPRR